MWCGGNNQESDREIEGNLIEGNVIEGNLIEGETNSPLCGSDGKIIVSGF